MAKLFHCTFSWSFLSGGQWYMTMCISVHAWASPRAGSCALYPGSSPRSHQGEMGRSKEGGALPLEWSSLISWTNHSTCVPAWNAERARFPLQHEQQKLLGRGKHPHSRLKWCPGKSAGAFLGFVPSSSKGHQLKSGIVIIASGLQFFHFITILSLFNAQGSGIKRIILNRVLLKQGKKPLWQRAFKVESSRLQRLTDEEKPLNLLNSPGFCSWLANCYSGCGITMCFLQIPALP